MNNEIQGFEGRIKGERKGVEVQGGTKVEDRYLYTKIIGGRRENETFSQTFDD